MKLLKEENKLIRIIQLGPVVFGFVLLLIWGSFIIWDKEKQFQQESETIAEIYYEDHQHELQTKINTIHQRLVEYRKNQKQLFLNESSNRIKDAYHTAENIHNKYKDTKSKEEILDIIIESMRGMRFFDDMGYYLIFGFEGKVYLNDAFPATEGTNMNDHSQQFKALTQILKTQNESFFSWHWYKPEEQNRRYEKEGFFKVFEPYGLIFGTGYYVDDFTARTQKRFLSEVSKIRYSSEDEYVFVMDYDGLMLTNYDKSLVGKNTLDMKDENGFEFIKSILALAKKNKEGFIRYEGIIRPSTGYKTFKTSYIKVFEPWQWVIGSGFYNEVLEKMIDDKKKVLEKKLAQSIRNIIMLAIAVTLMVLIVSSWVTNSVKEKFKRFNKSLAQESQKNKEQNQILQETLTEKVELENVLFNSNMVSITDVNGEIIYVNDTFCNMMGYTREELIGNTHRIMKSDKMPQEAYKKLWNTILSGKVWRGVSNNLTKDGRDIYLNTTISPIKNTEGQIIKFIATRFDITEKVNANKELRKKENILVQQSKMAAMGEMLGAIAHQWRQPLSVISIASTGVKMQKEMEILSDEFLCESMDSINDSVQYLSRTIDDFRNFFSPNKVKTNFDMERVIEKTFKLIKVQFENNCIQAIKNIEHIKLFGVENELLQVLINILNNAKDQIVISGVKEKYVFIETKKVNDSMVLTISDSAGGFKEKDVEKLFDPYFTTKEAYHGTGIGLYMSKEIIEKNMGGTLEAYNITTEYEGKSLYGACFKITLPIK